jgi:hypothetical protein
LLHPWRVKPVKAAHDETMANHGDIHDWNVVSHGDNLTKTWEAMADTEGPKTPPKKSPKNSSEGDKRRSAAYRERLKGRGVSAITLRVAEKSKPLFHRAAELIRDGVAPGEAFRIAGGSNEEPLPDREALERLIAQLTEERDRATQLQAHTMTALTESQRQTAEVLGRLQDTLSRMEEVQRQGTKTLATMKPFADIGKAVGNLSGLRGWLVRRWLGIA